MINKILFITLSNIGDVILTLPALDALRQRYPEAKITVISGPRPKEIFEDNPKINRLIIYDKHTSLGQNFRLFNSLKKEHFDLVVDLRNTFFGLFLPAKHKTSPFKFIPKAIKHMSQRHLYRLPIIDSRPLTPDSQLLTDKLKRDSLYIRPEDEEYINAILKENGIAPQDKIIVIAPGARSHIKRWSADKFLSLIPKLEQEFGAKIVLAGDKEDSAITQYILKNTGSPVADLAGKTSITELACLLKNSSCLITNDSAVLHLASYLDVPVAAIFGPTDETKYGPWSEKSVVVKKDIHCRPCAKAQCRYESLACMQVIRTEDVLRAVRDLLGAGAKQQAVRPDDEFKRILIVRTDRVGDVLLSTPVIKALREEYPVSYIAMMVSPYAKDALEGNPYLDEVIIYDKGGKHRGWVRSIKFAQNLKKKRFDLALILHPANRVHLVTFSAGIPRRVGYDRKFGFLLTDRIKHTKHLGEKHELEYNLDLAKYIGIEPPDKNLFMPIKPESEKWVEGLLRKEGINDKDKILTLHPAASCPSKIWPTERFAQAADMLIRKYGLRAFIIAGPKDIVIARDMEKKMLQPVINLAGKTSISQLASLLKKSALFISNDSGPVHIASAVGSPVISIFGRSQNGLSPKRWGPVGARDIFLHKKVGCIECLAHNCVKEFLCLKAITVDDVVRAAASILQGHPA